MNTKPGSAGTATLWPLGQVMMTMLGGVELFADTNNTPTEAKSGTGTVKVGVIGLGAWGREILDNLDAAIRLGSDVPDRLNHDPTWKDLRNLPQYQALLKQTVVPSSNSKWKRLIVPYDEFPEWDR